MEDPKVWRWDFDGQCAPGKLWSGGLTFSVGIFQWIPKRGGRGLRGEIKHGPVVQRVKGSTSNPNEVFNKAREIVEDMNRRGVNVPREG